VYHGEERAALAADKVEAEVSDLSRPEYRFERGQRELLEVYLPIRGPDGQRLRFEAYQRFSSISASGRRLWLAFAPALLGGLLLLQLANLPLARSMVRRLRDARAQRELMLRRAIDASDLERRRIAADLHDGCPRSRVPHAARAGTGRGSAGPRRCRFAFASPEGPAVGAEPRE
jgi:two-component system NarL family sensor kinase